MTEKIEPRWHLPGYDHVVLRECAVLPRGTVVQCDEHHDGRVILLTCAGQVESLARSDGRIAPLPFVGLRLVDSGGAVYTVVEVRPDWLERFIGGEDIPPVVFLRSQVSGRVARHGPWFTINRIDWKGFLPPAAAEAGCQLCGATASADRLEPDYAKAVCHKCLPPPPPLPVAPDRPYCCGAPMALQHDFLTFALYQCGKAWGHTRCVDKPPAPQWPPLESIKGTYGPNNNEGNDGRDG